MEPIPRVAKLLQQMKRHYRLHLCLVALCQAISLESSYSVPVDPSSSPCKGSTHESPYGGDGGIRTRVLLTFIVDCQQLIYYL